MDNKRIAEIVASARSGSEQAYRQLVEAYGANLMRYFYRNTGHQAEAEDLLQEVFLRLVRSLKNYKENERFEVWLYRLARNLLIDYWRKRKILYIDDRLDEEGDSWLANVPAETTDKPHDMLELAEAGDELQRALAGLPVEQRQTLLMRYFSEMSFEEVAQAQNVPIGTVLARAHRGLGKLRQWLKKE
ncbi:MAG: sigma-70 family RNA polymerase sigma factor [Phycisphaerae bacterium]|jgi:RNA polymerase sigma-70 factor (ECF subfamily)|nr:sigma-70 family RNA polymerase sigma factor [Phycisphaerae bacterium]